ncbi:hypothetical protein ACTFIU_006436 [Dictyostelium citrinum]
MDIELILNHNDSFLIDYNNINNKLDFNNNSDIIDIGTANHKNVKQSNNNELMLPPPTIITLSNQNDTMTYYFSGRSISIPRKMLIDPNTITDCGSNGIMFIAYNCETKNRVILKKLSRGNFDNVLNGHRIIRNLIYQRIFKSGKHIATYETIFKRKCSQSYATPTIINLPQQPQQPQKKQKKSLLIQQRDDDDFYFESIQPQFSLLNLINNKMLDDEGLTKLFYQLLCGLQYMHSIGVIHRDIDPETIFVDENFYVKFTEFNNCYKLGTPSNLFNKEYITYSYSYRAPETIYGEVLYSEAIDIWGLGILFAELLLGRRLFRTFTGKDHLRSISKLIGPPDSSEISYVPKKEFIKFLYDYHSNRWCPPTFKTIFKDIKEDFIDLLECMLRWDPRDRYSVEELFFHPCFKTIHKPIQMPCGNVITVESHVNILNMKPTEMIQLIDQEFLTQENN